MRVLTDFEQLVLLGVARNADAYGMVVRDEIKSRTSRSVSLAAVYSTLARLEEAGLVRSRVAPPTARRGGRATKHFEVSREGARALLQARSSMDQMWDGVNLESQLRGR